ncbi:hypothetical protein QTP86_031401 [Hemibagrus guttatus]|nr:hypothetical protein QTP86_031401 [Hemibagrus guttatus]
MFSSFAFLQWRMRLRAPLSGAQASCHRRVS